MKKITLFLSAMLISMMSFAGTATISFADKSNRTKLDDNQQVWEQNGLVVTNDKATSTNKVADYANPARFYKGSSLTIKCTLGNITKIEVTCGSNDYATALVNSVGAEAQANEKVVTISPKNVNTSYKVETLTAQVRVAEMTVTYDGEGGTTTPDEPGTEEPETPAEPITIAAALQLEDNAACVLDPFTVIYVSDSYIYIEDESAYALLYKYDFGLKAGDQVTGLEVTKSTYQGIAQLTPVTALSELTIVEGKAPAIDEITSAPTVADNHLVKLMNVELAGNIANKTTVVATCADNSTINIYAKFDYPVEEGKTYNIIGGVTQYSNVIQIQAFEVEEYTDVESGVEDVIVNEKMTKVIKDGKMYIIRDGKAYNVLGAQL